MRDIMISSKEINQNTTAVNNRAGGRLRCAGAFQVPPWLFFGIDIGVVICFFGFEQSRKAILNGMIESLKAVNSLTPARKGQLVGGIGLLVVFLALQIDAFASVRGSLFGEPMIAARLKLVDELTVGDVVHANVMVSNLSNHSATIVGTEKSCSCVDFVSDVIVIPPKSKSLFAISISPEKAGRFHQRLVLFLDHPNQFRMNVDVLGNVLEGSR
jgi:hypothetical protein